MLNDDESFRKIVSSWANSSGYFAIFVVIAVKLIEGIQWILRRMYSFVNKNYMALSREMEFHADEIAANITGYEPLKTSLVRLSLADYSFNSAINLYNGKISECVKSENIYKEQSFVMGFFGETEAIPFHNGFPQPELEEVGKFSKSKLVIINQWASHPSTEDRIARLEKTQLVIDEQNSSPANSLFKNIETLQQQFTNKMFQNVEYKEEASMMSVNDFEHAFKTDYEKNTFSKKFNSYYNDRNPENFELDRLEPQRIDNPFSDEIKELVYTHNALKGDIETLDQIADETFGIKTFDYEGKRYKRAEAISLKKQLEISETEIKEQLKQHDIQIFRHFLALEADKDAMKLHGLYTRFFDYEKQYHADFEQYRNLSDSLQFTNVSTQSDQIQDNFQNVEAREAAIKIKMRKLLEHPALKKEITSDVKEIFDYYLTFKLTYFENGAYREETLHHLFTALNYYVYLMGRIFFIYKREILDYQASMLPDVEIKVPVSA